MVTVPSWVCMRGGRKLGLKTGERAGGTNQVVSHNLEESRTVVLFFNDDDEDDDDGLDGGMDV